MRHFILASHGTLAQGVLDAVRLILGQEPEEFYCYGAYIDKDEVLDDAVEKLLNKFPEEDELIVVTDIIGGSVCNCFIRHLQRPNLHVLAGLNLGFALELFANRDLPREELIAALITQVKTSICYCNPIVEEMVDEEL